MIPLNPPHGAGKMRTADRCVWLQSKSGALTDFFVVATSHPALNSARACFVETRAETPSRGFCAAVCTVHRLGKRVAGGTSLYLYAVCKLSLCHSIVLI